MSGRDVHDRPDAETLQHLIERKGIVTSGELANGMHREGRNTDIERVHSHGSRSERADGAAATEIGAIDKTLQRYPCLVAHIAEQAAAFTVSGIALVGVDLQYRALIENRLVVAV